MKLPVILVGAVAIAASGQTTEPGDPPLASDRPGFATTPVLVPRGFTQLEGGFNLWIDGERGARTRSVAFGSPVLRTGVSGRTEFWLGGDGFRVLGQDGADVGVGWSDLTLGAKIAITPERGVLPSISLAPSLVVPTGRPAFTSSSYDPGLAVAWAHGLPASFSISGNVTGVRDMDDPSSSLLYSSTATLGIPAPAGLAPYVEVYATGAVGSGTRPIWVGDMGVSRGIGRNLQLDVEGGRRISAGMPCWFVGAGFTLRRRVGFVH